MAWYLVKHRNKLTYTFSLLELKYAGHLSVFITNSLVVPYTKCIKWMHNCEVVSACVSLVFS